jgi:large subunit ribosomal protein L18
MLKSGKARLVVRRSLNNFRIQIVKYEKTGDRTFADISTKDLKKYGWKGHANLSAAYLTGMLAGFMAKKAGVHEAIVDLGVQTSIKGSSLYAAVKGAIDAGLHVNADKKAFPKEERIAGKHIEEYAKKLHKENHERYTKQFSSYLRSGFEPEKMQAHFSEVMKNIMKEFGAVKNE